MKFVQNLLLFRHCVAAEKDRTTAFVCNESKTIEHEKYWKKLNRWNERSQWKNNFLRTFEVFFQFFRLLSISRLNCQEMNGKTIEFLLGIFFTQKKSHIVRENLRVLRAKASLNWLLLTSSTSLALMDQRRAVSFMRKRQRHCQNSKPSRENS